MTQDSPENPSNTQNPAQTPPQTQEALVKKGAGDTDNTSTPSGSQRLVYYSVLAGLCPLIPVPFIDDLVLGYVRKRFFRGLFRDASLSLSDPQMDLILHEPGGCVFGCVSTVIFYPLTKIFRKVFFFLSIKGCVDVASKLFHQGFMLQKAIEAGHIDADLLANPNNEQTLKPIVEATNNTLAQVDARPIEQVISRTFSSSKRWMRQGARQLWGSFRQKRGQDSETIEEAIAHSPAADTQDMNAMIAVVDQAVWMQSDYLQILEKTFFDNLTIAKQSTASPPKDPKSD